MRTIADNLSELTVCFREAESLTGDRHTAVARLHSDYQSLWAKALDDGYQRGEFRRLPHVALKGLLGMYFYSFLWLNPTGQNSAEDIADIFAEIVKRAAAPDRSGNAEETRTIETLKRSQKKTGYVRRQRV